MRLSGGGAGAGGVCEDGGVGVGAVEAIATETHHRSLIILDPVPLDSIELGYAHFV